MENSETESIKIEPVVEPKKEIEVKAEKVDVCNKEKRNGKDEKPRSKKDDKTIEQILKSLGNLETPEEKLSSMCKKYLEVIDENRKLQATLKQTEKKVLMIQREKEQFQSEKSKAVLTRSRLESLCRELQRQNKAVKEESLLKIREEEEKRKEVSAKFQSTLAEITALMAETNEKNVKLHEDNIEIHKKFKSVFDEMDIREQHFEGMHQMMKHELQVAEAKLAKVTLEMTEEKEILLKEKNQHLLKLTEYQAKIKELQTVEANLRSQVNMYTDKYEEFQSALTKSNKVFGGFNEEMEKMSKKILKLEKETSLWKSRWEKSHAALLEMAADKQTRDAEIATINRKCSLLQELCKAFQQERATLLAQLKEKSASNNEENKTEDNQMLIESVKNAAEALTVNGTSIIDDINAKLQEQTKEIETETVCPTADKTEVNVTDSSREVSNSKAEQTSNKEEIENITTKTVNREDDKRLDESIPTKTEETECTINSNISTEVILESSTECKSKETTSQVPVEVTSKTETVNTEKLAETKKEEVVNSVESNTPDTEACVQESQVSDKKENHRQDSVISEIKDAPKMENNSESVEKVVPNGEVQSHPVTSKKCKLIQAFFDGFHSSKNNFLLQDGKKKKSKN